MKQRIADPTPRENPPMDETTPAGTPEPDGTADPAAAEAADGNASPARDEEWERLRAVLPECREPEDVPEPARRLAEDERT